MQDAETPRQVFSFTIFSFFQNRKYGRQLQMSKHTDRKSTDKKPLDMEFSVGKILNINELCCFAQKYASGRHKREGREVTTLRSRVGARDDGLFFGLLRRFAPRKDDSTLVNDRFSRSRWSLRMTWQVAKWVADYYFGGAYLAFLRVRCNLKMGAFQSKKVKNRLQNRKKTCKKYAKNTQKDVILRVFCTFFKPKLL